MSEAPKWIVDLIDDLFELVDREKPNRAALAQLRRGLGSDPTYVLTRVGWLFRAVPPYDDTVDAAVLAAGLFALGKGDCRQRGGISFGKAFGSLPGKADNASIEKRFIDLIDTDRNDLPHKIRQALTLVARESISFDWRQFVRDLLAWDHPDRYVQRRWARDFWSASEARDEPEPIEVPAQPS